MKIRIALIAALLTLVAAGAIVYRDALYLIFVGDERKLRDNQGQGIVVEQRPKLLIIGIDGLGRDLVYDMLRKGELPGLATLLGGAGTDGEFAHALLVPNVLSIMPSTTLPAWASVFTGEPPSVHGVAGNEYFIREMDELAAPAPVSVAGIQPTLKMYSEGYANGLLQAPTLYERLRKDEPGLLIWVAMAHFYKGADKLLLAAEAIYASAFEHFASAIAEGDEPPYKIYRALDEEILEGLEDEVEEAEDDAEKSWPEVLTLYLPGLDLYTHQNHDQTPDAARRTFLREVLDPKFGEIHAFGERKGAMHDRWIVLVSDHGHSSVTPTNHLHVDEEQGDARALLRHAGFRVRPFDWKVVGGTHQAVLAYGGATAYVYLVDRSACAGADQKCDWRAPPRYKDDVLHTAEAFHRANTTGEGGSALKDALELILVREPRPYAEDDLPFQVYLGNGKLQPLAEWLAQNPRPNYPRFQERLAALAEGRYGERAGDIMLITHFGNVDEASQRYYFAAEYYSWHGSPSRRDSEVPLIVAHQGKTRAEIAAHVASSLGSHPTLVEVGRMLRTMRTESSGTTR